MNRMLLLLPLLFLFSCTHMQTPIYDLSDPSRLSSTTLDLECTDLSEILYLIRSGDIDAALTNYQHYTQMSGAHDQNLIKDLGYAYLENPNLEEADEETRLLTIFSAGITGNRRLLPVLEQGLQDPNLQVQLASVHALGMMEDDEAFEVLKYAFKSNYVLTRLEAVYLLAQRQHPSAVHHIESLMHRLDPSLRYLFPQLLAIVGDAHANNIFRKLLNDQDEPTRIEAILNVAKYSRDDFLPEVRILATHLNLRQQEVCAFALGNLRDKQSEPILLDLMHSSSEYVRLAAYQALYRIGNIDSLLPLIDLAKQGNGFAINILGEVEGSEEVLLDIAKSTDPSIKLNAVLALLEHRDQRVLPFMKDILSPKHQAYNFVPQASPTKSLTYIKVLPFGSHQEQESYAVEMSTRLREQMLLKAKDLPEEIFLELAKHIFDTRQYPLVPLLVEILQTLLSEDSIELLKEQQQKAGAPLIRAYCNLALFKLKEPGPWKENLFNWILEEGFLDIMKIRPVIPMGENRCTSSPYHLTAEESSKLLIDSFLALTINKDDFSLDTLLKALKFSNIKNKFALASLLIRATD